jgi:hypothetical protein
MKAGILDPVASGDDAGGSHNSASEHHSSHNSSAFVYHLQTPPSDAVVDRCSHNATEPPTLDNGGGHDPEPMTRRTYHKRGRQHQERQLHKSADKQHGPANDSAAANRRAPIIESMALEQFVPSSVMLSPATSVYPDDVAIRDDQQGTEKVVSDSAHSFSHLSAWRLWPSSMAVLVSALCGIVFLFIVGNSMVTRPFDTKNCRMSYMRPSYIKFHEFDSEYTRFATKYSLYLYREQGVDYGEKVTTRILSQEQLPLRRHIFTDPC